ncbi:hypothetical protein NQ314_008220 [Rhamnusium bicolor]|uniref:Protein CASC3 n=1 Tax=Rhamnusium bicolor TaxID=1586634 RepID=A0AAV8YF03_9CUCU|nr:hypothetical protein NQ314_008220 [Rhamnusium bicolor]
MEATKMNGNTETALVSEEVDNNNELNIEWIVAYAKMILQEKTEVSKNAAVEDKISPENSEYDSADSYSDEEQDVKIRSRASDQDEHENSDTGGSLILEREEGDGQESLPSKKVDDDEDKKNPQYIPKRGTFYEHDDRTADDVEVTEAPEAEKDKEAKKKVWQDKKEKWSHDRFNDTEQAPKSRTELISIYGYDIRNEDGPPRARRRRRYGRGPNKYTRNWEDEDAYNKPPLTRVKKPVVKPKKNIEEFPPLGRNQSRTPDEQLDQSESNDRKEQESFTRKSEERNEPRRENNTSQASIFENNVAKSSIEEIPNNKTNQQRVSTARIVKPKKEIKDSDYRGFTTKTRQQRNIKIDQQKVLPPRNQSKDDFIQTQNFTNKNSIQDIEKDMSKLSVDNSYKGVKHNQRQCSVPPRLQSEQKGSKRYSSMRQRSLPEANTPPVPNYQHTSFYPNDYNPQTAPPSAQPPLLHQPPQIHPPTAQVTQMPPPPLPPIPQQVPVTAAPLLQAQFPQGFPQAPPAFLQPGVPPPPFISPQTPQIINYVQGQPPFAPNYQSYQQQFNPVVSYYEMLRW